MQSALRALYAGAHSAPVKLVAAVSGGGVDGVRLLLATEGASSTVLETVQPYARESFQHWCGVSEFPQHFQYASEEAAFALASASLRRAKLHVLAALADNGDARAAAHTHIIGVGLAGAIRSTEPRRGTHRCHVAVVSDKHVFTHELVMDKGVGRSRVDEDALCGRLLTAAILQV
jgi:hypothetical protein